jgi:hypothetical protein
MAMSGQPIAAAFQAAVVERSPGRVRFKRLTTGAASLPGPAFPFRYEYHEFVQVLGGATYVLRRADVPRPEAVLGCAMIATDIERGVQALLDRVAAEGWRPAGPTDASSLWHSGYVAYAYRRRDLLGRRLEFSPVSVRVPCERVVW